MSKRKDQLPKSLAVKRAATAWSVSAILRSRNQVEELRGARVVGADGAATVPIDWIGGATIVDDAGHRTPVSAQAAGRPVPYGEAVKELTTLGLSPDDWRQCESCKRWFLAASRNAQVCPDCRPRLWPTKAKKRRRAAINQELADARARRRSR